MKQTHKRSIRLIKMKNAYKLTQQQLADLMEVSLNTIKSYTCNPDSERYRTITQDNLDKLSYEIQKNDFAAIE